MNTLSFLHFFNFTVCFSLVVFVLVKNPKSKINQASAALILCFALWNFGDSFVHGVESINEVFLWARISSFGWAFFPAFFLWLVLMFTKKKGVFNRGYAAPLVLSIPSAVIFYMQWRGNIIANFVDTQYGRGIVWGETLWAYIYYVYLLAYNGVAFFLLYKYRKGLKLKYKRKQVDIIFISAVFTLFLGCLTNILVPGLDIYSFPSVAPLFTFIWVGGVVYAITRCGLLNINPAVAASDILSSMSDALVLMDPYGIIVSSNEAAEKLSGYNSNELKGKSASFFFEDDDNMFSDEGLKRQLLKREIRDLRVSLTTKERKKLPVSFSSSVIRNREGEIVGVICIAHDMREIVEKNRQLEESYRHHAELREKLIRNEKMAIIGRLAGAVGHEIRTPLSSMRNTAFYLERYGTVKDEDSKNFLKILVSEIERAENIVDSLLNYAHASDIKCSEVDIDERLSKVINSLSIDEGVKIIKNIPRSISKISADPGKVELLFSNLIKNALQAIEGEGKVKINMEETERGKYMFIEDSGTGFDEKDMEKVFKPLFTTKISGIGLGLAIVKGIADAHGWEVALDNKNGTGAKIALKMG